MKRIIYLVLGVMMLMMACTKEKEQNSLQVIFTNDSHSQIEPLKGLGGFEARAAIIDSLREQNPNTLLLDAGDMWQGTPYFNLFKGRLEVEAYNLMGYDAVTIGNHEFDYGIDTLAARISEMDFQVVCCNYDFSQTKLANLVLPYVIREFGNL